MNATMLEGSFIASTDHTFAIFELTWKDKNIDEFLAFQFP